MSTSRFRGWALGITAGAMSLGAAAVMAEETATPAKSVANATAEAEPAAALTQKLTLPGEHNTPPTVLAPILDGDSARMSFQGRLTDNAGDPLPGPTVDLSFQLYDENGFALGAAIAMNNVSIQDGIVDTLIPFDPADFDGAARQIGVSVDGGAELAPRLDLGATPYAYRVNRVASEELDDAIDLGNSSGDSGFFRVFGGGAFPAFVVEAAMRTVSIINDDNSFAVRMLSASDDGFVGVYNSGTLNAYMEGSDGDIWSDSTINVGVVNNNQSNTMMAALQRGNSFGGRVWTNDAFGDLVGVFGGTSNADRGGVMQLFRGQGNGGVTVEIDGEDGNGGGGARFWDGNFDVTVEIDANDSSVGVFDASGNESASISSQSFGGRFEARDENNQLTMIGGSSTSTGGFIQMYNGNGLLNMNIDADSGGASLLTMDDSGSTTTITLDAEGTNGGATMTLRDGSSAFMTVDAGTTNMRLDGISTNGPNFQMFHNGIETVHLIGNAGGGGGAMTMDNAVGDQTVEIDASEGSGSAALRLGDEIGSTRIELEAMETTTQGGIINIFAANGTRTIELDGEEGESAVVRVRRLDNTTGITLDADWSGTGSSRIVVDELQITGGADLSEQFDVSDVNGAVEPGMVVCIDPKNPGKLVVSAAAYDRTVAGIVSGANGIKTGMYMGQDGSNADGKLPVALTGRVYCKVDATNGPIEPGDLLTTSAMPGHAMKVNDHAQSQGAIIGKAMTGLDSGTGLVLVLVSLQ